MFITHSFFDEVFVLVALISSSSSSSCPSWCVCVCVPCSFGWHEKSSMAAISTGTHTRAPFRCHRMTSKAFSIERWMVESMSVYINHLWSILPRASALLSCDISHTLFLSSFVVCLFVCRSYVCVCVRMRQAHTHTPFQLILNFVFLFLLPPFLLGLPNEQISTRGSRGVGGRGADEELRLAWVCVPHTTKLFTWAAHIFQSKERRTQVNSRHIPLAYRKLFIYFILCYFLKMETI